MHVNQQIREAVRERIETIPGIPSVFTNRSANLTDALLPAVVILTSIDDVRTETSGDPPPQSREVQLSVVVVADGEAEGLDDDLDGLRAEIERALAGDLGGLAWYMEHTGGELDVRPAEDGERWYAFLALSWTVRVWTAEGDPEEALK